MTKIEELVERKITQRRRDEPPETIMRILYIEILQFPLIILELEYIVVSAFVAEYAA
ncbi:hypothetical protein SDJN02_14049 [Cucurbita argyrosperma subsp. argyrosperma]|nr:hypothetical protein SDJN02_14049 [Cucurbita argyrosperma subsp. argyrosperma]